MMTSTLSFPSVFTLTPAELAACASASKITVENTQMVIKRCKCKGLRIEKERTEFGFGLRRRAVSWSPEDVYNVQPPRKTHISIGVHSAFTMARAPLVLHRTQSVPRNG